MTIPGKKSCAHPDRCRIMRGALRRNGSPRVRPLRKHESLRQKPFGRVRALDGEAFLDS